MLCNHGVRTGQRDAPLSSRSRLLIEGFIFNVITKKCARSESSAASSWNHACDSPQQTVQPTFPGDLPDLDHWSEWKGDALGDCARHQQGRHLLLFQLQATTTGDHHLCSAHEHQQDLVHRTSSSDRTESSRRSSRSRGENSIVECRYQLGDWKIW